MDQFTELLTQIQQDLKRLEKSAGQDKLKQRLVLAEKVKFFRSQHHLTLEDLAKRLYVTKMAVIRWEKGEVTPSESSLARFREMGIID
jgi:DNA-binding transcriptional regulator YiaG